MQICANVTFTTLTEPSNWDWCPGYLLIRKSRKAEGSVWAPNVHFSYDFEQIRRIIFHTARIDLDAVDFKSTLSWSKLDPCQLFGHSRITGDNVEDRRVRCIPHVNFPTKLRLRVLTCDQSLYALEKGAEFYHKMKYLWQGPTLTHIPTWLLSKTRSSQDIVTRMWDSHM